MQLFGIFATILQLSTGHVDTYGPGHCIDHVPAGTCGPYAYFADCQATAAQARTMAHQLLGDKYKVTVTCAPIKQKD